MRNTAGILLPPFSVSTAFAGIKSIFLAIAAGQPVEWEFFSDCNGSGSLPAFSEDISVDMRVHSDLSEMPYMKAFPGSG